MKDSQKIIYEPHPVSPERKAELRAQGLKIIDARFQPQNSGRDRQSLDGALDALPGDQSDPDYVVRAMRSHFGEVFTDFDEDRVRAAVKAKDQKPSDGLKVDELKAALDAKGVQYGPDAKKADLQVLYDAME